MVDGKTAVVGVGSSSVFTSRRVRHPPRPVGLPTPLGPLCTLRTDVEHFQPVRVLLSSVADQVRTFDSAFRRITFGEVD